MSGEIITKKSETESLRADLKKERENLRRIKTRQFAEAKQKAKNKAIRESIARIRREQSLLTALSTNRISPERVDSIRHGSKEAGGARFGLIPGLVG